MAFLRHYVNGQVVSIYEIRDTLVIGRHPECEITIDDPTVSGRHIKMVVAQDSCEISDLDSTNGIRVNGEPITHCVLTAGMTFAIGTHEFQYLKEIPSDLDRTLKIKKSWIPGVYYT